MAELSRPGQPPNIEPQEIQVRSRRCSADEVQGRKRSRILDSDKLH